MTEQNLSEYKGIGKYSTHVHPLESGRYIVAIRCRHWPGVSSLNPSRKRKLRFNSIRLVPLEQAVFAFTFEELAADGTPTYANERSAIKAARSVYPELRALSPWRTDPARSAA